MLGRAQPRWFLLIRRTRGPPLHLSSSSSPPAPHAPTNVALCRRRGRGPRDQNSACWCAVVPTQTRSQADASRGRGLGTLCSSTKAYSMRCVMQECPSLQVLGICTRARGCARNGYHQPPAAGPSCPGPPVPPDRATTAPARPLCFFFRGGDLPTIRSRHIPKKANWQKYDGCICENSLPPVYLFIFILVIKLSSRIEG